MEGDAARFGAAVDALHRQVAAALARPVVAQGGALHRAKCRLFPGWVRAARAAGDAAPLCQR
jgi:hypothetical protein